MASTFFGQSRAITSHYHHTTISKRVFSLHVIAAKQVETTQKHLDFSRAFAKKSMQVR
jgi:hypothetical protein